MSLYTRPETTVTVNGKTYKLSLYFNRVLFVLCEIYPCEDITPEDKLHASLDLLVSSKHKDNVELFEAVIRLISGNGEETKKTFDFEQDSDAIYSGFMQAYGIDLNQQHDKMHWKTFVSLLQGLPRDTRFVQTVELRMKPIPKITKDNREQVTALMQAKSKVALKVPEAEAQKSLAAGLNNLFDSLKKGVK